MSNNNNNNALTVGDLLNDKKGGLWMTTGVQTDLTYNGIVKALDKALIKWGSYYEDDVYYDAGNYTRDRSSYSKVLDVVKTKSKDKPNPRYNLTIIMSCVDSSDRKAFIHHDDAVRSMSQALAYRGFLPLGDKRAEMRSQVEQAENANQALNYYCETVFPMVSNCAEAKTAEALEAAGLAGLVKTEVRRPTFTHARWSPEHNNKGDATAEELQAYIDDVEKRGELVNQWLGECREKFDSNINFRNTFLQPDAWDDLMNETKQFYTNLGRASNGVYESEDLLTEAYAMHKLGHLLLEDQEKLTEINKNLTARDDLWDHWDNAEAKRLCVEFGLTNRWGHAPDIAVAALFSREQLQAYLAIDKSVFDLPVLWADTLSAHSAAYHFSRGRFRSQHNAHNFDEWIDILIIALGGEYSLWN